MVDVKIFLYKGEDTSPEVMHEDLVNLWAAPRTLLVRRQEVLDPTLPPLIVAESYVLRNLSSKDRAGRDNPRAFYNLVETYVED